MSGSTESQVPWILWPFYAVWKILTFVLNLTGRIICAITGLLLMVVGIAISMSVIGAIVGIPLAIFGILLTVRALF
jgi:hypothetical protein